MKKNSDSGKKKRKFFTLKNILIMVGVFIVLGFGTGAGVLKASEKPSFCAICHNMDKYYDSYRDEGLLANKHAKAGVTCHDCHQEGISKKMEEGVKYVTGDYETPLKKRDFGTRDFCLKCHDFDKVKKKTAFDESNPHDNHNGKQNCNVCHNMHQKSKAMCEECHSFKWMDDLDESWKK